MKYLVGLTDVFMSPLTGKLRAVAQLPNLGSQDYIIIGDPQGNSIASPALIDVKLDIVELRTLLDKLRALKFIIQQANFIAPNAQALDELVNGFLYNNDGVLSIEIPGGGTISLPYGQIFVGDAANLAQPTQLLNKQLLIGNASDRAEPITILHLDNMANLTNTRIWRGNGSNRPVESDALSTVESSLSTTIENLSNLANVVNAISNTVDALSSAVDAIETGIASVGGFAAILLLQAQVLGLIGAVASLSSRMSTAEGDIDTLQSQVATINSQITSINNDLISIHLQLTAIESNIDDIEADIVTINGQITTIFAEIDDINDRIDNLTATFIGDVQGSGLISAPINLELMLTLDQIKKAEDTVDLNNNKIINLVSDDVEQLDALNAKFLWDLMHDNVGVVWV
jgi:prefoldin subunit 5